MTDEQIIRLALSKMEQVDIQYFEDAKTALDRFTTQNDERLKDIKTLIFTFTYLRGQLGHCRDFLDNESIPRMPGMVKAINETFEALEKVEINKVIDKYEPRKKLNEPRPLRDLVNEGYTHFWLKTHTNKPYQYAVLLGHEDKSRPSYKISDWMILHDVEQRKLVDFVWKNWAMSPAIPIIQPGDKK